MLMLQIAQALDQRARVEIEVQRSAFRSEITNADALRLVELA
jgi:hypothetical protein